MTPEVQRRVVLLNGKKYIASDDFRYFTGKQPAANMKGSTVIDDRKYVLYDNFERHYYRIRLTDGQYTQVMNFYTETFGEIEELIWVDFVRAAKFFILKHCHWPMFRVYHEFIPDRIPQKVTYGDLAEFDIPADFAIELSKKKIKKRVGTFEYDCTKAFERPIEDIV